MGNRLKVLLLIVGVLTISFGVIDSQAVRKKHRHAVAMKYFRATGTLPPANDPATSGVESLTASCPAGYRATGGSYDAGTIATVPTTDLRRTRFAFIAVNETNETARMEALVACIKRRTTARRASTGPGLHEQVERLRAIRRRSRG